MEIEIDAVAFRDWLQECKGDLVGWSCNEKQTPIVEWLMLCHLKRFHEHKPFYVTTDAVIMGDFEVCIPVPAWVSRFCAKIDAGAGDEEMPFLGCMALAVFDHVYQL